MKNWISKRKWLVIVIAVVIAAAIGLAVFMGIKGSLSKPVQEKGDVTVSLSASSIQLDIHETLELKATVTGSEQQPVWTTQDSNVATVENGIVTAVGEGTTNVIATVGEAFCACQVSVVNSYAAPVIVVNTPNICLGLNEQYGISVKLRWKGAEVTEPVEYKWMLAEDGKPDVAAVEQTADGTTVKALAYGKTAYIVSTTYRGQLVAQRVDIKVTNLDITFEIANMEKSVWAYKTALGLIETDVDATSIVPQVTLFNKGQKVENGVITWESENPEIATVDENGKITAVSAGTARIVGFYDNAEIPIAVEVYRTKIVRKNVDVEQAVDYKLSISQFSGSGEITDVLYDGESVLKEIKDGQLVLDSAMLPEIGKEVKLSILSEKAEYTTEGMMATFVINSESELKQFPKFHSSYPTGYFILGNDIRCSGTYASNATEPFNGTFDGRGHAIYNFTTSDENRYGRGLFGKAFGVPGKSNAVLKNIAFINAKHSKDGAFLAQQGGGLLENVYINIGLSDLVDKGGQNKTTVLFSYMYNTVAMDKVFIEHSNPLVDVGATGYAITHLGQYGNIQGLYIIGAEKVCEKVVDNKSGADVIGIYPNYREFLASGKNLNGWSNEFWATYNKVPYPSGRNIHSSYMPEVTAPTEALTGTTVTIQGVGFFDEIVVSGELKRQGLKVDDNVLSIPENMKNGTVMQITVRSVFNHNNAVKLNILVNYARHLHVEGVTYAERMVAEQFTVDLSGLASDLEGVTLKNVTLGEKQFASASYENGILTLDTASLGDAAGENLVVAVFEKGEELIVVNIPVFACDMVINDARELKNFPTAMLEKPDGYFALGADIYYTGTYENTNTVPFTGTFDGQGYIIFDLCTKISAADWDGGLFGKFFGKEDGSELATLKNISFMNATVKGQGAFLACKGQGTLENVYMLVSIDGLVSSYTSNGWINNTSVLFNTTPREHIYINNVVIEYAQKLTDNNGWGYAFGDLNSLTAVDGLYIVGADKAYNNLVNSSNAVAMGCYADRASFNANVSSWNGNGFWTVVDGFPIPNRLVNYVPPKEPETVILDGGVYLEKGSVQTTFAVDLSAVADKLSGLELTDVTVDGVSFTTQSYDGASSVLTLNAATVNGLLGEKTVLVSFGDLLQIKLRLVLCTQIIDTAAELKAFPAAAKENPDGYYALGADIYYEGTYENTNTVPFTGTFDGQGYIIFDLCTKISATDWDGGFFGKFFGKEDGSALATLKNISFVNATVKGQGAFLACKGQGTLENVYMQVTIDGLVSSYTTNGWINNTSILFNTVPSHQIYINNMVIEYAQALTDNNGWGYAFGSLNTLATVNGLYIVGADGAYNSLVNPSTAVAMGCYGDRASFDADVSAWDGNGFWTVVDGFPIPNRLVNYEPPREPETVTLDDGVYLEKGSAQSTFTVDLSSVAGKLSGLELKNVTVDGVAFAVKSYDTGILTLDTATVNGLLGEKTALVNFGDLVQIEVKIVLCTQIIDTVEELKAFPAAAKENPNGYYALGADIYYEGIYENPNTVPFTGTFDGQGHTIFNLCTKVSATDWDGGLFGKFFGKEDGSQLATLKNISFMNATVKGQGSFLACKGQGTLENVYMLVNIDGLVSSYTSNGWINNTSILFNTVPSHQIYINNVVIEYGKALTGNNGWGYAFGSLNTLATVNGLYIVGADGAYNSLANPSTAVAMGCYADRASFDADVSAWDGNGFWTVVDGFPVPDGLVGYDPSNPPEPSEPEESEPTEPEETEPSQTVQLKLAGTVLLDKSSTGSTFTVNFGEQKAAVAGATLNSVSVAGKSFTTYTYADGILRLDKATLGTGVGEKMVQATFQSTGKTVQVDISVIVCTQVIDTAAELRSFPTAAKENPDGYYALGADIHFEGTYENTNTVPFTGTFDGQGHTIYDLCTKVSATDWDGGLFGKFFGKEDGSALATLKNISFMNATVKGQGSFLACKGQGTLENVYMQVVIDGLVSSYTTNGWINNTSVFFNTVPSHRIYINNVILEFATPLTDNNSWGYAFGSLNTLATVDGLYIVGADRAYNSLMNASNAPAMGCYADAAAFQTAGIDFTAWYETDFWVEGENKTPVPKSK